MDPVYIRKVLSGSTDDFRFLIRKYKDLGFSVAVSVVKNEFDAEEVVQEAFIKAFLNLKSLRDPSNFKTWFCRILINEAFKRLQRSKNESLLPMADNVVDVEDIADTFHGLDAEEQRLLVSDCLKKLPPRESLSLQLFYLEGNNLEEISQLTGWSEANVKVILHRARKHMLGVVNNMLETEFIVKTT
jgi:RNA polymerase sigma factor (sigma-70 family)